MPPKSSTHPLKWAGDSNERSEPSAVIGARSSQPSSVSIPFRGPKANSPSQTSEITRDLQATTNFTGASNHGWQVGQNTGIINYFAARDEPGKLSPGNQNELVLPFALPVGMGVETFVGREKQLSEIRAALKAGPEKRTIVVLYGLGGIGKTQLATKYAKDHFGDYHAVIWLNGNDADSLDQSLASAAQRLRGEHPDSTALKAINELPTLAEIARAMVQWLSRGTNRRWLLVLDNVDNPKLPGNPNGAYDIAQYVPAANHGHIIVTTRLSGLNIGTCIPVRQLVDVNESLAILATTSERLSTYTDADAATLARRLDGLPLALATAGALLRQTSISFAAYLKNYEQSWQRLQEISRSNLSYRDRTLQTTWDLSFDRVKKVNSDAADLLRLWAYYDHQDLWYGLIETGRCNAELCPVAIEDELAFHGAMRVLQDHCLAEPLPDSDGYGCHACVHDWIRNVLQRKQDIDAQIFSLLSVGSSVPGVSMDRYWILQRRLIPHANLLLVFLAEDDLDHREGALDAIDMLGTLYENQDKPDKAEKIYLRALAGKMKTLGPDNASTLRTINNLGIIYETQGKLCEAESMYRRALASYEKTAEDPNHKSKLHLFNNLGVLYEAQDKLDEAESMYLRALAGYKELYGVDHSSTLGIFNNLGNLYKNQHKPEKAESMYQQALAGYEKIWDSDHISTLRTINNLGILYKDQGKMDKAEAMLTRALKGYRESRGEDHPKTQLLERRLAAVRKRRDQAIPQTG